MREKPEFDEMLKAMLKTPPRSKAKAKRDWRKATPERQRRKKRPR